MAQLILGLDIGATSVRAVVVDAAQRSFTVAGAAQMAVAPAGDGARSLRDRQLDAVRALFAAQRFAFDSALVALPGACASHVVIFLFTDVKRI